MRRPLDSPGDLFASYEVEAGDGQTRVYLVGLEEGAPPLFTIAGDWTDEQLRQVVAAVRHGCGAQLLSLGAQADEMPPEKFAEFVRQLVRQAAQAAFPAPRGQA